MKINKANKIIYEMRERIINKPNKNASAVAAVAAAAAAAVKAEEQQVSSTWIDFCWISNFLLLLLLLLLLLAYFYKHHCSIAGEGGGGGGYGWFLSTFIIFVLWLNERERARRNRIGSDLSNTKYNTSAHF
jgi:hypothetical protein